MLQKSFFTAAYQNTQVQVCGQWFDAGSFAVSLLNRFYDNDLAARLGVMRMNNDFLIRDLQMGYLNQTLFYRAGEEYQYVLKILPRLEPFNLLDLESERQRLAQLFSQDSFDFIQKYLLAKARNASVSIDEQVLDFVPEQDTELFQKGETMIAQIRQADRLYHSIAEDMRVCYQGLRTFVAGEEEADRLDESCLLPMALETLGIPNLPTGIRYIQTRKPNSEVAVVGREMTFDSYKSFILTDFFEGLHSDHYPRQCQVCGKYFLMKSARWQYYCDGWSGHLIRGHRVSCRQYGEWERSKEYATENPIKDRCTRRCGCIRAEKSRGLISAEFAEKAKILAQRRRDKATRDPDYAMTDYETEMTKDRLYADVKRGCEE